jgi:Ca2+-binding RTX toxin-like protein
MQFKISLLVVFFVFIALSVPAHAANDYPFVTSWGSQGLVKTGFFAFPQYVAVDEADNIYITDLGNFRVQKFDNTGTYLHSWGSKGTGQSQFVEPVGIATRNNYVYVVDHGLNTVKKFDSTGNFIKSWGSEGSEPGKLKLPYGIAVSKDNYVYVADTANARIQKFDSDGNLIKTIGSSGTGQGQFLFPLGVTVDNDGNVYVGDSGNNKVLKFNSEGVFLKSFSASSAGMKISPDGLAIDSSNNIIVADAANNRIVVMDKDGNTKITFGSTGTDNGQFKMPKDVAIDSDGNLFVVDSSNNRIQKFGSKPTTPTTDTTQQTQLTPVPNDFKKPTVVPPKDIYTEASGGLTPVLIGKAIAEDESGIKSLTNNAPTEFPLGTTTVIWTAIDGAGNVGMATQTITVVDTTPPVITNLSDIVAEAKGAQNTVNLGNPTVTDVVGVLSVTNDAPQTFPLGTTTVTWTAIDVAKNIATYTQKVTITDKTPPKIRAPASISVEATSLDHNQVNLGEPNVSDNTEVSSVTNNAPQFFPLGETEVIWTAADLAGNVATATQKVTIVDTTAPIISKPQELVIEAVSATTNPVTLIPPNVTDVQEVKITNNAPQFFTIGQTTITWTAVDLSGNNSTVTQTISVVDTTPPTLVPPKNITQEATGLTGNQVTLGEPVAEDITGISSISNNAPTDFPFGMTMVTWTATDNYGNSVSANQTITIVDTTKPQLTAPKNVRVEATSMSQNVVILGEPKVSDLVQIESVTNDAPSVFPLGDTTVTWTAKDTSGNIAIATQIVSVVDTTPPVLVVPQDLVVEATSHNGTSVSIGEATATDILGINLITNDDPHIFKLGNTTITWTANDTSGNVATATQKVTIVDTTAPTITAPADITVEATSATDNTVSLVDPEAKDSVSHVTITNNAPAKFPLGETTITWTATDEAGNTATATQKVTIVDTTAPTITAPADITVEATSKSDNTVTLVTPNATDNVAVSSITNDAPEKFPVGQTIVTWTAKDNSGNTQSISQKIIVVDTIPPKFTKISPVVLEATSANENKVSLDPPNVSDILGVSSLTNDAPDVFPLGETTITWTATDEAGNTATATQKVTIVDTTPPQLIVPQNIVINAASIYTPVSIGTATVNDLTDKSPKLENNAPILFPLGNTTVTWMAVDKFGNMVNQTQTITIQACGKPVSSYNLIMGTEGDDALVGTTFADLIFGLGGNDIIYGGKGNDCIFGGDGNDIIYGGDGDDTIYGENGDDIIYGNEGNDTLIGGTGNNIINGGDGKNTCIETQTSNDILLNCEK